MIALKAFQQKKTVLAWVITLGLPVNNIYDQMALPWKELKPIAIERERYFISIIKESK